MSDAGESGYSAMPSYFDAVPQTADTAPDDGLGDWSGIINPNYMTEPVFTEDQLAAVRALPEMAGLGVDLTEPPPDFLAGTGLTPAYADFDFSQYNPSSVNNPAFGPAALPASLGPTAGQNGFPDLFYRFTPGQQDNGPQPIGKAPLNSPIVAVPLAAPLQGNSPVGGNAPTVGAAAPAGLDANSLNPSDSVIVTGQNAPPQQEPAPSPQPQQGLQFTTPDALDRSDPVTAPFAPAKPPAPLTPPAATTDNHAGAPSIATGPSFSPEPTNPYANPSAIPTQKVTVLAPNAETGDGNQPSQHHYEFMSHYVLAVIQKTRSRMFDLFQRRERGMLRTAPIRLH